MYPPMGNYWQHISDCDPKLFGEGTVGRPGDWQKPFCCPGSRFEQDAQRREKWLCQFGKKKPTWKFALPPTAVLHHPENMWRSYQEGRATGKGPSAGGEPTAATGAKGDAKGTARRRRLGRMRNVMDNLRVWVNNPKEAGLRRNLYSSEFHRFRFSFSSVFSQMFKCLHTWN